jgi:hypothetical protein
MHPADNVNRRYFAHYVQSVAPPGAVVLDYGCGAGVVVEMLREAGYDAYGVDIRWPGHDTGDLEESALRAAHPREDPHEPQLVLGRGAGDDGLATESFGELVVVERVERRATVQHLGYDHPGLAGGRGDRGRVVAADDDRPHARVGELGHGIAHAGA